MTRTNCFLPLVSRIEASEAVPSGKNKIGVKEELPSVLKRGDAPLARLEVFHRQFAALEDDFGPEALC